jgi:hypothetical protein
MSEELYALYYYMLKYDWPAQSKTDGETVWVEIRAPGANQYGFHDGVGGPIFPPEDRDPYLRLKVYDFR